MVGIALPGCVGCIPGETEDVDLLDTEKALYIPITF